MTILSWFRRPKPETALPRPPAPAPASEHPPVPASMPELEQEEVAEPETSDPEWAESAAPEEAKMQGLLKARQFDEAAALIAELAPSHASQDWFLRAELALARARQDGEAILEAASRLRTRQPAEPAGYVAASGVLRSTGRLEEAETLMQEALAARPGAPRLLSEAALVAAAAGHHDLAFDRWAKYCSRLPSQAAGYTSALTHAVEIDDAERAQQLITDGLARFPKHRGLLSLAARYAARKSWWPQAREFWSTLLRLHPDDAALAAQAARSLTGKPKDETARSEDNLALLRHIRARFPDDQAIAAACEKLAAPL